MSQADRILELARRRGQRGFDATEFLLPAVVDGGKPIIRVAARIFDLQQRGFEFSCERLANGTARYVLVWEPAEVEQESSQATRAIEAVAAPAESLFDTDGLRSRSATAYEVAA